MDRQIIYPGQIPLETDLLNAQKNDMIGLAKLAAAVLGTGTQVMGLGCAANSPAALNVVVSPGEIYSLQNIDGTAYSSLAADTAHQIVKQGILLNALTLSTPAPATAGQSINYLIQAAYLDADVTPVVLPYYNASNPSQAYSGPANAGTTNNTIRQGQCSVTVKSGTAATTGSQTTPAADSGYTGLYVVTVANGQATVVAGNITPAVNAPILPSGLVPAIQSSSMINAVDTGVANAAVVSYSPAVTALTDGMVLWFKAKAANTGATTLNVNGLGVQPVVGGAHSALQGGEIVANGKCMVIWNATLSSWVLMECTGGALQVSPGSKGNQTVNLGQFLGSLISTGGYAEFPVMVAGVLRTFIFQWGQVTSASSGGITWTYPISFPNAVMQQWGSVFAGSTSDVALRTIQPAVAGLSSCAFAISVSGAALASSTSFSVFAIGY